MGPAKGAVSEPVLRGTELSRWGGVGRAGNYSPGGKPVTHMPPGAFCRAAAADDSGESRPRVPPNS